MFFELIKFKCFELGKIGNFYRYSKNLQKEIYATSHCEDCKDEAIYKLKLDYFASLVMTCSIVIARR